MLQHSIATTEARHTGGDGFAASEQGSMTILALFFFISMVIIGGVSIDIMMFENNRTRLQNLSDRAALAAADLDQTVPAADIVASYFEKEGLGAYLKSVQVNEGVNRRSVRVETEKVQKTMFMNFWNYSGVDTLTPRSLSEATEAVSDIEISLVLDVSNSMNWASSAAGSASKIADLKNAATRFIDKIYETDTPERITVSLVPYSTHVNAGPVIMDELGVSADHGYSNCLAFQDADFDETRIRAGNAYRHTAHFDQWYSSLVPQLYVCRAEADQIVKPVMGNPTLIKQRINELVANGNTSIEIGMKWGAAFLDPSARRITNRLASAGEVDNVHRERPYDWDRGNTEKFIIVLTDGVNTVQQELTPAYSTGNSGVYRWVPYPLQSTKYYSWRHDERGDEDGDGVANERFWHPRYVVNGVTYPARWMNEPFGTTLGASISGSIPPAQLTFPQLWNEMSVRYFAQYIVRAVRGRNSERDAFYNAVWTGVQPAAKDARLLNLCDQVRANGVTVFTIGFEVTDYSASIMSQCASTPNYFIRVVGNDLEAAFDAIAANITKLRLTQ